MLGKFKGQKCGLLGCCTCTSRRDLCSPSTCKILLSKRFSLTTATRFQLQSRTASCGDTWSPNWYAHYFESFAQRMSGPRKTPECRPGILTGMESAAACWGHACKLRLAQYSANCSMVPHVRIFRTRCASHHKVTERCAARTGGLHGMSVAKALLWGDSWLARSRS